MVGERQAGRVRASRKALHVVLAWTVYAVGLSALAALGHAAAGPWSALALPLLLFTGFLLPWRASALSLAAATLLLALVGGSLELVIDLGGVVLPPWASFLVVALVLMGTGLTGQLALASFRRAAIAEAGRLASDEQSRRLRLILRGVSHEINNGLQGIYAATAELDADERERRAVKTIEHSVTRIKRLTGDLSDAAKLMDGEIKIRRRSCDLAPITRAVIEQYASSAQAKQLRLNATLASVVVEADQDRVEQVLANLLQNAIRYTPGGGCVDVAIAAGPEGAEVCVRDTGLGLTTEQLAGLFHPFVRYHPEASEGSGLGLWLVKRIMAAHGGVVTAASEGAGAGATFRVRFPPSAAA